MIHESDLANDKYTATYCPEDNKLRLYCGRVERSTYNHLRANKFTATPKQQCDFVASWSVNAEDIILEMIGPDEDIEDEDTSPEERAFDRATRFAGYREKRYEEATGFADAHDAGPAAFGYQSQSRAEKAASRHNRLRRNALTQWSKAEYWQSRTTRVIGHALHKSSPGVRRERILTLEKELRRVEGVISDAMTRWTRWSNAAAIEDDSEQAAKVTQLIGASASRVEYGHPDNGEVTASLWHLIRGEGVPRAITGAEAVSLYLARHVEPGSAGTGWGRWRSHLLMRIAYENQMLESEGGKVTEVEIIPGGWLLLGDSWKLRQFVTIDGWGQIQSVNRSPVTKRVTSVTILGADRFMNDTTLRPRIVNIERLGEESYRPPTAEELAIFVAEAKEKKAAAKAAKPKGPSLINPTSEDGERLQAVWNTDAQRRVEKHNASSPHSSGRYTEQRVVYMTQAEYSAAAKGTYARCATVEVGETGRLRTSPVAFTVRKTYGTGGFTIMADRVIVITDKPQKSLPLRWDLIEGRTVEESQESISQAAVEVST